MVAIAASFFLFATPGCPDAPLAQPADPQVRSHIRRLERQRPGNALPITLMLLGSVPTLVSLGFLADYLSAFLKTPERLYVTAAFALAAVALEVVGGWILWRNRAEQDAIDNEIDDLRDGLPLPPPVASRLPPAPVFVGYGASF